MSLECKLKLSREIKFLLLKLLMIDKDQKGEEVYQLPSVNFRNRALFWMMQNFDFWFLEALVEVDLSLHTKSKLGEE